MIRRKQFLILVSIVTLSLIVISSGSHAFVLPTDASPEPSLDLVVPSSLGGATTRELLDKMPNPRFLGDGGGARMSARRARHR